MRENSSDNENQPDPRTVDQTGLTARPGDLTQTTDGGKANTAGPMGRGGALARNGGGLRWLYTRLPRPVRLATAFVGFAASRFGEDGCGRSAAALTYTSLLALVPLMTITFSLFSAFPAFQDIESQAQALIFDTLVPQVGQSVLSYLDDFSANAGRLTAAGIIALILTSVLLLATIEGAFNAIWRVREKRPLLVRLLSFWAILTLTPLLFGASLSVTAQVITQAGLTATFESFGAFVGLMPFLFECVGFTVLYLVIPNRAVRWSDAVIGGVIAAVLFELSKTLFAAYLVQFPVYETIYGAVSTVPIFLVWLYVGWSIVLLGAVVAAALPDFRAGRLLGKRYQELPATARLSLALSVLHTLAGSARDGGGVTRRQLAQRLRAGTATLDALLEGLRDHQMVQRGVDERWYLARDLSHVTLADVMRWLGLLTADAPATLSAAHGPWFDRLSKHIAAAQRSAAPHLNVSLAALLSEPATDAGPAAGREASTRTVRIDRVRAG